MSWKHDWKMIDNGHCGGQQCGVPARNYKCQSCGIETGYSRGSTFRIFTQHDAIDCKKEETK
jgi:hypothetical protein